MRGVVTLFICLLVVCGFGAITFPKSLDCSPELQNVFQLSTNLYSGSQPEGELGFIDLEKLGVKTILSVDGAMPDVETARRHGMRYVHLPIGYDGISSNRYLELAKFASTIKEPVYVHCHHGRHRGPAAAATLCMANGIWTPAEALEWLRKAGTSTNYLGLYRSIRDYQPDPKAECEPGQLEFPEITKPSGLVQSMVAIDEHLEHLKACAKAGWSVPSNEPDILPAHEALMLWEQFKELQRTPEASTRSPEFQRLLAQAQDQAARLSQDLRENAPKADFPRLNALFNEITQSCQACHTSHRN